MDCKTARLLLDFARPGATELDEGDGEALATHLAECSTCAIVQQHERRWDEPLGRAMRDVPVPPELRGRLLQCLAARRDAWYRRRVWPALAAAAAAALLIWLGVGHLVRPLEPDLVRLHEEMNLAGTPAAAVTDWLQRHDGNEPPDFNASLLTHSALVDFQGKRVPLLEYRQGAEQAWVYVLHDGDFNLKSLDGQLHGPSGRFSIAVLVHPDDPHTAYVVVYTGADLAPFLQSVRPAA